VEFRLDSLKAPVFEKVRADLARFSGHSVFTVRPAAEGGDFVGEEAERIALIRRLGELAPAHIDVELRTLEANRDLARGNLGRGVIVSWHDPHETPGRASLLRVMDRAASYGGLSKVVTTAKSALDNLTVLSLYDVPGPPPIAFCMGARGVVSRVMAVERRSPIVYACLPGEPTAPGQLSLDYLLAVRRRFADG
jgi:3-dehydroquinate dehydratase type I